ncbi:MAG: tetratricopeptide repeat protein [Myxococcota bacterium]
MSSLREAVVLHEAAAQLYAEGAYEAALEKLRAAIARDPQAAALHYNVALIEERRGNIPEALEAYRRSLELEKNAVERRRLASAVARLEGAIAAGEAEERFSPPPVSAPPPPATLTVRVVERVPEAPSGTERAGWGLGGAALGLAAVAGGLALGAALVDPGNEPTTTAEVDIDRLQADANRANRLATAADVFAAIGVATGVAAVTVLLVEGGRRDRATAGVAFRPGAVNFTAAW